jgi:hypothetical protein
MRGSTGFLHAPSVRVSPVLIFRRWSANAAWKARVSNLERAQAWMPERMPGGAALGSPEPTTMRVLASGRQLSRRWTFSPPTRLLVRGLLKWRKTQTLLEHPPTPSPRYLVGAGFGAALWRRPCVFVGGNTRAACEAACPEGRLCTSQRCRKGVVEAVSRYSGGSFIESR